MHSALTDLHTHLEAYSSPSHNRDNPLDTCLAAACLSGGGPAMYALEHAQANMRKLAERTE